MYLKQIENSNLKMARSQFVIEDCTVKQIYNYAMDSNNIKANPAIV